MSINERIRQLRQALNLSQAKFAKGIPISNSYIAGIELGNREVNDRLIKLISTTYGVSAVWLKTGSGEMFEKTSEDKLAKAASMFKELSPDFQDYILQQIEKLLEIHQKNEH